MECEENTTRGRYWKQESSRVSQPYTARYFLKAFHKSLLNFLGVRSIFKRKFILGQNLSGMLEIALRRKKTKKHTNHTATENMCEAYLKSCVY